MTDANIMMAKKTITTPCCNKKKPLDAMKYHNTCIDCATNNIESTIEDKTEELIKEYKKENQISKEEEKEASKNGGINE